MFDELNGELISYAHMYYIFTPGASNRIERYTRSPSGEEDGAKSTTEGTFKKFMLFPSLEITNYF